MNKGNLLWAFVGLVAVMGGAWAVTKLVKGMTSTEAIKIIAKHRGKDPKRMIESVRLYQNILASENRYDFGVDNDFLIARAKAIQEKVTLFMWKGEQYNSDTGQRVV